MDATHSPRLPYDETVYQTGDEVTYGGKVAAGSRTSSRRGGFAGFSWGQLLAGLVLLAALIWAAWTTREVMALKDRRIVSVSLASMANDFIMAEARAGNSPEQTDADTRHYMAALQQVLKSRSAQGEVIIVSEAVVAGSVPDITPEVRKAVGEVITASPPPRVQGASPQQQQQPANPSLPMGSPLAPQGTAPAAPQGVSGVGF